MSEDYLAFVRNQVCCSCGVEGRNTREGRLDPHHFMEAEGGTALKVGDYWTVPLCRTCHDHWHDHRKLPCYAHQEHDVAVANSRAQLYRTQARLLGHWMDIF